MTIAIAFCGVTTSSIPATAQGSLPGDTKIIPKEVKCITKYAQDPNNHYVNYLPAIGAPEHTDSIDTGVMPCATFTGKLNGKSNTVLQNVSQSSWESIQFIVFDGPDFGYVQGGGLANSSAGEFVAKFDASTGQQIWQTYLEVPLNPNQWIAFGSVGIHQNGYLYATFGPSIYKLDRNTGEIVASAQMTVLGMPPTDANFDGFRIAPDANGTILMKTQTRSIGCPIQGNQAISECPAMGYGPDPNTTVVAVDPITLQTIDAILLDQNVIARPIVVAHGNQSYMYMNGSTNVARIIWDPSTQTLSVDNSWAPVTLLPGQTGGDAPDVLGNWVILNSNAAPSTVPQSIVAVNANDATQMVTVNPWGTTLPPGIISETPASPGVDPDNGFDLCARPVYRWSLRVQARSEYRQHDPGLEPP